MNPARKARQSKTQKALGLLLVTLFVLVSPANAAPSPDRPIDVVAITWPTAKSDSIKVQDVADAIRTTVGPNWRDFTTTQGAPENSAINFVPGIIAPDPIALVRPMACEGTSSLTLMSSLQREFYRIQNISKYDDRYLLILTPEAGCIWQGKALLGDSKSKGGVITLHNTASGYVITHELGHTFGLGHSNLMSCSNNANDGSWGRTCRAIEYGGTIDVMGNVETTSPLSTYHQWRMGLIDDKYIYQSWLNESRTLSASDVFGPTRAIFIRDGNSTYWVEYRRGFGQYKPGLAIYRTDPPPISAVESANPYDLSASEYTSAVTTDVWMLNWDDYRYSIRPTSASGSMTLPVGKTATVFSGNISISASATSNPTAVNVTISRKADRTAPPTPSFSNPVTWRSGDTDIVIKDRDDGESRIAYFELKVDDFVSKASQSAPKDWIPSYLEPLTPKPTIFVKDLPEGTYQLSIRSTDVWGNTSDWSPAQKVTIDRTPPVATRAIQVRSINRESITVGWIGAKDNESGLCDTSLANSDGWATQRSTAKKDPTFSIPVAENQSHDAFVFDCFGNGVKGSVDADVKALSMSDLASRTGKLSVAKDNSIKCTGRCSLSVASANMVAVNVGSGSVDILVSAKRVAKASPNNLGLVDNGNRKRFVRIQGSDFTINSIATIRFKTSNFLSTQRGESPVDSSLVIPEQIELSKIGFRSTDFVDGWSVLPMSRGTTLLDPTLDLCSATFNSESDRTQRRQVIATKSDSPYDFLSSEVVKYANATAASNALAELRAAFEICVQNKGGSSSAGLFTPYTFYDLPKIPVGLVSQSHRVIVRATLGDADSPRQLLAIYQYKGAIFSGLYLTKSSKDPMTDEEVSRWLNVAKTLASRL